MIPPKIWEAMVTIVAALITGGATIIAEVVSARRSQEPSRPPDIKRRGKLYWLILFFALLVGGFAGFRVSVLLVKNRNILRPVTVTVTPVPTATAGPTPTTVPAGTLQMEINFSSSKDGKCDDHDRYYMGYDSQQYYVRPKESGYIAICHQDRKLAPRGSLQVDADPEGAPERYGYAVLFGWQGSAIRTRDGCFAGVLYDGATTQAVFGELVDGERRPDTMIPVDTLSLDDGRHTLRVVVDEDLRAVAYLDERFVADHTFTRCIEGPVGVVAFGSGETRVYFDDLRLFSLP